jgi:pyruvate kinase
MLEHLERAKRETGRDCRVLLDLAGPKLRTGAVEPGPRVIHWQPELNALGEVEAPALVWLTPATNPELPPLGASAVLPLDPPWLARLSPGDVLTFVDLRGEPGELLVREAETSARSRWAESTRTAYVGHDTTLIARSGPGKSTKPPFEATRPWAIAPREQGIQLQPGDTLILSRSQEPGQPVLRGPDGKLVAEPRIPCTLPEVFPFVKPGERIWFDDGKFGGVVAAAGPDELRIQITRSPLAGKKLRADKGINLPDSRFDLPALTPKDLEDLDFAVERADIIGLSFVNRPEDVEELARQIAQRTSRPLGIILKIETRRAFQELPRILLAGLKTPRVGVMIARGDLAVECGYERLAEIQEEILWLCEAAHVPAIWATQVLESMNKKGYPTRAEVTDAAMGERAECVMLNKGPHVCDAMRVLDDILGRMEAHQDKKSSLLRPLSISQIHASPANHFRASGS